MDEKQASIQDLEEFLAQSREKIFHDKSTRPVDFRLSTHEQDQLWAMSRILADKLSDCIRDQNWNRGIVLTLRFSDFTEVAFVPGPAKAVDVAELNNWLVAIQMTLAGLVHFDSNKP